MKIMNWDKFQQQAFNLTEKEIAALEKEVIAIYETAKKEMNQQIKDVYAKVLSTVGTQDYYNQMIKYDRLTNLLNSIEAQYIAASKAVSKITQNSVKIGISNIYYRKLYAAKWLAPEITVGILPEKLIQLATYSTASAWKDITAAIEKIYGNKMAYPSKAGTILDLIYRNQIAELDKIRSAITQGLITGKSYRQMIDSIYSVIGVKSVEDGVLSVSGAMYNSLRIIRTESGRAMSAGAYASTKYAESQGLNIKKQWSSTLDMRTRPEHTALDGTRIKVDEYFRIGNDFALYPRGFTQAKNTINCRCAYLDIIDDKEPSLRIGRNPVTGENEYFDYKSFDQWAKDNGIKKNKFGQYY